MKPTPSSGKATPKEVKGTSESSKAFDRPAVEAKSDDTPKKGKFVYRLRIVQLARISLVLCGGYAVAAPQKKQVKRVKWADHFGDPLSVSKMIEGNSSQPSQEEAPDATVSWSDRRRRDRLREKELLAQVK